MFDRLQVVRDAAAAASGASEELLGPPQGEPIIDDWKLDRPMPDVCPVCLEARDAGDSVVVLSCGHCFHSHCARKWLTTAVGCPTCRARVPRTVVSTTCVSTSGAAARAVSQRPLRPCVQPPRASRGGRQLLIYAQETQVSKCNHHVRYLCATISL